MISYQHIKSMMQVPPPEALVDLYNAIGSQLVKHHQYVSQRSELVLPQHFHICGASIQSHYIAYVLGKLACSNFPPEVIHIFFDIDANYKVQFGEIGGERIDACICVIHQENTPFDLQAVYKHIYS